MKRKKKRTALHRDSEQALSALAGRRRAGEPRMAEVLADIAEPLLRDIPDGDVDAYEGALMAAAVLWNSRLLRIEPGLIDPVAELKAALVTPTPPEFDYLYQEVLDRSERLYPGLDRMIAGVQLVPRPGGGFRIDVASVG